MKSGDKHKDEGLLEHVKTTVDGWLRTMTGVIEDRQKHDEELNEECGLRNEMDYWK